MNYLPDEIEDAEISHLIEQDVIAASGYFEHIGEVKVIERGKETDAWYANEEGNSISYFHTLSTGKAYHVRVCEGID